MTVGGVSYTLTGNQQVGVELIQKRLTTLTNLEKKADASTSLTAAQHQQIDQELNAAKTGLTTLSDKLGKDTTVVGASADVKSIYTDFRVYKFVKPQIKGALAASHDAMRVDRMQAHEDRLAARVASGSGGPTAAAALTTLQADLATASSATSGLPDKLLGMTVAQYNADGTSLASTLSQVTGADAATATAHADIRALKGLL